MTARVALPIRRRLAACSVLIACLSPAAAVRAQDKPAAVYDEWKLLEPSDEMLAYKNQLRDGSFDDSARAFLTKTALPQLENPNNRATIDRVRRRMREVLCGESGSDPRAATAAMQVVSDAMMAKVRDAKAKEVVRLNAMLMVGELRTAGNKPWTPAVAPLVAALEDAKLPPFVRIAAAAGLARHVEADPVARSADIGPAALTVAGSPLDGVDAVAADWLRSRALVMLARMGSNAPKGTVPVAAKLLTDASRPIDLRVRAAAAVGRCIKAPPDTDVAAVVAAIRDLATTALGTTKADADRRDLAVRLAGGAVGRPEMRAAVGIENAGDAMPTGPSQVYRRDAWRLATLADALAPETGEGGVASAAGPAAAAIKEVADLLRKGANDLDKDPGAASLVKAIEDLAAGGQPAATPPAEGAAEAAKPAAEQPGVDGVPFGGGNP